MMINKVFLFVFLMTPPALFGSLAFGQLQMQWVDQIAAPDDQIPNNLVVDEQGNLFVVGITRGPIDDQTFAGISDGFIASYTANGFLRWLRQLGTESRDWIGDIKLADNSLYVCGVTEGDLETGQHRGGRDSFIAKYDTDGNLIWLKQFGTAEDNQCRTLTVNGNRVYVVGTTQGDFYGQPTIGGSDVFAQCYTLDGDLIWTELVGSTNDDSTSFLSGSTIGGDGNLYVCGETNGEFPGFTRNGSHDLFIAKVDVSNGSLDWVKQFGSDGIERMAAVCPDPDGGVFFSGHTFDSFEGQTNRGGWDYYFGRIGPAGTDFWLIQDGTEASEIIYDMQQTSEGQIYIAGSKSIESVASPLLIKLDENGNEIFSQDVIATDEEDRIYGIALGHGEVVNACGFTRGNWVETNGGKTDGFIAKFAGALGEIYPQEIEILRGQYSNGSDLSLYSSDNLDYSIIRSSTDLLAQTELQVECISPIDSPATIRLSLESAVFARRPITQSIAAFDFVANEWVEVDSRVSSRFNDSTVSVPLPADMARFVETGSNRMLAKITYHSESRRQIFSSHIDRFIWNITP